MEDVSLIIQVIQVIQALTVLVVVVVTFVAIRNEDMTRRLAVILRAWRQPPQE